MENAQLMWAIIELSANVLREPGQQDVLEWFNIAHKAGVKAMVDSLEEDAIPRQFALTTTAELVRVKWI